MFARLTTLFAESGPSVHVAPGADFTIAGVNITNSMVYGWICITAITLFLIWAARRITVKPQGGAIQFVEAGVEFIVNLVENAFNDRATARKYVPFFVTLFFFILLNNWLGLLPIVGEGIQRGDHPFFRPFTGDLNATLGIGLFTMIFVYSASIREAGGILKYLRHFFVGNPLNPGYFLIGLIEMFTDLTRVISLSVRLFLNVTIGEILISIIVYLTSVAAPLTSLPFTLLELFVGALQAYIFTILGTMYLAVATNAAQEHAEHDDSADLTEDSPPETISVDRGAVRG